ncbi:MAG: membrane protein insertase YidC [Gammaproteobacteria bacterium]|nr:membrane protein insertase YidC [Gammaproteobacteria bacterium]
MSQQAGQSEPLLPLIPQASQSVDGMPAVAVPEFTEGGQATPVASSIGSEVGQMVQVETDLFNIMVSTEGGDLRRADLLQHGKNTENRDQPFRLLDDGAQFFIVQSGIKGAQGTAKQRYPGHNSLYHVEQNHYLLGSEDSLRVPMVWDDEESGLTITKTYIFHRNSYKIDLEYQIENRGTDAWKGGIYAQLLRNEEVAEAESAFIYTYTGGVAYTQEEHYQKIDFDEIASSSLTRSTPEGWVAMVQHYFLGAVIPHKGEQPTLYTYQPAQGRYAIGAILPAVSVEGNSSELLSIQLYVGPKDQDQLEQIAEGLGLTVDYGWLTFLAQPIFWVLKQIQDVVGNWGFSIILLTMLIKLVFFKLSETSYRSMAQMRKLTPRLTSLKERYGDDRQKMNEAMMRIYREEKVNPMGGCLPILVQIPVFIALYWVLLESVEIRQSPFIFWIDDLSAMDPYYILPLLMGGSMLIQQRLNPAPIDPIQQKVMMILPIVFTVFFAFFPSGLVLYWVVNNLISISQQYYITRKIEAAG